MVQVHYFRPPQSSVYREMLSVALIKEYVHCAFKFEDRLSGIGFGFFSIEAGWEEGTLHFWCSLPLQGQLVSDPSAGGQGTSPAWWAEIQ